MSTFSDAIRMFLPPDGQPQPGFNAAMGTDYGPLGAQAGNAGGYTPNTPPVAPTESDPYGPQIDSARGTLAKHYDALETAIKAQYAQPSPAPVSAKFGTKDLIWAIPALLAAASGSHMQSLAAGMVQGSLQGKEKDVAEANATNMGIYNNVLRSRGADVQAAQARISGDQSLISGLENQQYRYGMLGLGKMKADNAEIGKLNDQLNKAPLGSRGGFMQQVNAASVNAGRPAPYSDEALAKADTPNLNDLKTMSQTDMYGAHGKEYQSAQAFIDTKNEGKRLQNEVYGGQMPALIAQPGLKNEQIAGQISALAQRTNDYHNKVSADVALEQSRQNLNDQLSSVVVPKAQALMGHLNNMDAASLGRLELETKKAVSQSMGNQLRTAQTAYANAQKSINALTNPILPADNVKKGSDGLTDQQRNLQAAQHIRDTDLKNAGDTIAQITSQMPQIRGAMGMTPDGFVQKPAAGAANPTQILQYKADAGAMLAAGKMTQQQYNDYIKSLGG